MAKRRNYTQELLRAQRDGKIVVISLPPYRGLPVRYEPRSVTDPTPWTADIVYRLSGRECHAVTPEHVGSLDKDIVLRLIATLFDGSFEVGYHDLTFDYTSAQQVTILTALASEGLLDLRGGTYVITRAGLNRLDDLGVDTSRLIYV